MRLPTPILSLTPSDAAVLAAPILSGGSGSSPSTHCAPARSAPPLPSGELGDDRGELVGEVGADDDVGEADLFRSPLDFLGGGRSSGGGTGRPFSRSSSSIPGLPVPLPAIRRT
jgi:hypothetical protein